MKPLLELIEDYGDACYEHGRLGVTYAGEDAYDKSGELLTEMRARLEVMERDAARYRWLRDCGNGANFSVGYFEEARECTDAEVGDCGWERVTWHYEAELDAAIDAAMAEGE